MVSITWLHLSDLHFKTEKDRDQDRVLRALLKDIAKMTSDRGVIISENRKFLFTPSFVLVSGDIAYSGEEHQYTKAEQFMSEVWERVDMTKELGCRRTYMVPGNHDIMRKRPPDSDKEGYRRSDHDHLSGKKDAKSFHDFLKEIWEEESYRRRLFDKFQQYEKFIAHFSANNHPNFNYTGPSFIKFVPLGGTSEQNGEDSPVGVEIAGLCTAWIGGRDNEDGTLVVGPYQIDDIESNRRVQTTKKVLTRIAILHHPFRAIHDFDVESTRKRLSKLFDFLLFGHLHREYFHQEVTPECSTFHFSAGACYDHPFLKNSYNIVQLKIGEESDIQSMTVCTRVYRRDANEFTGDYSRYRGLGEGIVSMPKECLDLHNKIRNRDT